MKYALSLLFLLTSLSHCFSQLLEEKEGFIAVEGGRIWYKVVGKGKGIPLLLIHGGPGGRSCSGIPGYSLLGDDRQIIFYDQLGSGNSDKSTDTTLWKLSHFVNEVVALRETLGVKEVNILGHSWGATVAVEYMLTKKPAGVKSVIFAGPLLSTPVWMKDAKILLSQLPQPVQDTIEKYERLQKFDNPAYRIATDSFNARYNRRVKSASSTACDGFGPGNRAIYYYMWGSTEFNAIGNLKKFDRVSRLHELKLPVLFVAGRYDEARPETMYDFQKLVKGSRVSIIEGSAHGLMNDRPEQYRAAIRKFLNSSGK
jgi:proline iminopeptidase